MKNKEDIFKELLEIFGKNHSIIDIIELFTKYLKKNIETDGIIYWDTWRMLSIFFAEYGYKQKILVKQLLEVLKDESFSFIDSNIVKLDNDPKIEKMINELIKHAEDYEKKTKGSLDYIG